jgi:hypothetical protein
MKDISAIRVLKFTGKKEEWLTWNEKSLAKARISGIKLPSQRQMKKSMRKLMKESLS